MPTTTETGRRRQALTAHPEGGSIGKCVSLIRARELMRTVARDITCAALAHVLDAPGTRDRIAEAEAAVRAARNCARRVNDGEVLAACSRADAILSLLGRRV